MYSLTREVSALTAVRINRFCRFLRKGEGDGGREGGREGKIKLEPQTTLCPYLRSLNREFSSSTIFSSSSINSFGRSAVMKAFTVSDTSSGS